MFEEKLLPLMKATDAIGDATASIASFDCIVSLRNRTTRRQSITTIASLHNDAILIDHLED